MTNIEFKEFQKIPRWSRPIVITEKLDGTNASILITEDGDFLTGSRNRWITPEDDNYGFSRWAHENKAELMNLGAGHHFGEWWGLGIQRRYGIAEKRFSLFNTSRWTPETLPKCCHVVPVLYTGQLENGVVEATLNNLALLGSVASRGFMLPEGIIVYHVASRSLYKKTIDKDYEPKSKAVAA